MSPRPELPPDLRDLAMQVAITVAESRLNSERAHELILDLVVAAFYAGDGAGFRSGCQMALDEVDRIAEERK